ncbi:MAG: hypothetical protein CM1200mP8_4490 [Chloroflexota bacterium]|nr:MAG: hypothetical protein CM1200mP8_4490 [Chloroflexota bacterium]
MTTKTSGMPQFYVSVEQDYVTLSNEAALAYATNRGDSGFMEKMH